MIFIFFTRIIFTKFTKNFYNRVYFQRKHNSQITVKFTGLLDYITAIVEWTEVKMNSSEAIFELCDLGEFEVLRGKISLPYGRRKSPRNKNSARTSCTSIANWFSSTYQPLSKDQKLWALTNYLFPYWLSHSKVVITASCLFLISGEIQILWSRFKKIAKAYMAIS